MDSRVDDSGLGWVFPKDGPLVYPQVRQSLADLAVNQAIHGRRLLEYGALVPCNVPR